jgi:Zn-finger nucleic acid-binding protein
MQLGGQQAAQKAVHAAHPWLACVSMYRTGGAMLRCPECSSALVVAGGTFPIHGCTTCGGAWLGHEAAIRIMQGYADDANREVVETAQAIGRGSSLPPRPTGALRGCPQCDAPMAPLPSGEVMLDSCPAHGTWFDRDEIVKVMKAAHAAREKDERRKRGEDAPSAGEIADGVVAVATGLVTLPFRGLWNMLNGYCEVCKQSGGAHYADCPEYVKYDRARGWNWSWRDDDG